MADPLSRYEAWWNGTLTGNPLMHVVAKKEDAPPTPRPEAPEAYHTDIRYLLNRFENGQEGRVYLADAYPSFDANLGPGSLALYLGGEPDFAWDTVWYKETMEDLATAPPLAFDPENKWWRLHYGMYQEAKKALYGRARLNIPDIIENLDTLAALYGTENTLFAIMDEPEQVRERVRQIDEAYFTYYDAFYDLLHEPDGSSSYTAFCIQGKGRVAKIQCDFSAMLSPDQFRDFVLPSLQKQVRRLDRSLYHLDGPDAIRHVPALMELSELNALQWTCGAGQPDGGSARWYGIYDQVSAAKKSLWIQLYDGGVRDWIQSAERLMDRYGKPIFFFIFPLMSEADADTLLSRAHKRW